jgi:succinate dehydrogenase/fumarate reductase flavoprotein subunit
MNDDEVSDVLVVGSGPGGLAAADRALELGASVRVLEAGGELGGNAAFSTGYLAFAGTSLEREHGINDSADLMVADIIAEVGRKREDYPGLVFDLDVAERFAADSAATFEYLVSLGFTFDRFVSRPLQHQVDRTVVMTDPAQFRGILGARVDAGGAAVHLRRRAVGLVTDSGTVTGVLAERPGGEQAEYRAGTVILATGGYQAGPDLRARFVPDLDAKAPFPGLDTNRGDAQLMAERAGGHLVNMEVVPEVVLVASRLVEDCIAVTEDGVRFHDEAGPERDRLRALRALGGAPAYYVCDARTADAKAQLLGDIPGRKATFATLAALARAIGAPSAALEETVARWNEAAAAGGPDPEFGRVVFPKSRSGITTPPFTVAPLVVGTNITGGGAQVSPDGGVLRADGRPVPGLYAVGDCNGSISAINGMGGVHIAAALTMGRVAATSAVR